MMHFIDTVIKIITTVGWFIIVATAAYCLLR